ncbi:hypothetical protein RclHR1_05890011 [Rhizophagus clarus]|uniref:Crinkler effector protein N-terminal domain-containing protein n=1 Tax=Rhizophagus clarus TaxID=94130 RepID=A0A2Z6S6J2_9GLOM|nr:hypothetical protein RclHR1_05890011 [Rhizophagus clarus]
MLMEPNCILLGKTSINDSFTVRVCDKNNINGNEVLFDQLKISGLKYLIYNEIKKYINNDYNDLNLWNADIAFGENLKDLTVEQICKNSEHLVPIIHFKKYFPDQDAVDKSLIFVQVPVTVLPDEKQVSPNQVLPRATSIEDAMKKILEGIHESMAVDVDEPKSMALKQRDFKQAIDVIDKYFRNSLVKQKAGKKATPTAKTNYRILLCGGAPGIGKTRYGIELFDWLDKEWDTSKKPKALHALYASRFL